MLQRTDDIICCNTDCVEGASSSSLGTCVWFSSYIIRDDCLQFILTCSRLAKFCVITTVTVLVCTLGTGHSMAVGVKSTELGLSPVEVDP